MNRAAAVGVLAALALPGTGEVDPLERLLDEAARAIRKEAFVPASRSLDQAIELAASRGDSSRETRARRLRGFLLDATGDGDGANLEFARARGLARSAGDSRAEAAILRDEGFGHWRRAEYADAGRLAEEALRIQTAFRDQAGEGASLDLLGRIALKTGHAEKALGLLRRARALRRAGGDRPGEIESHLVLLATHLELREFDRALDEALLLERRGREIGDRDVVVEARAQEAITWLVQGAPEAALDCLARAREAAGTPPDAAFLARLGHLEANARRALGDHEGAVLAHEKAIAAYAALGNRREVAWNLARRGRSLAVLGRTAEAEASIREALAVWDSLHDRRAAAYWTYERGRLLDRSGREDEAWEAWEEALRRGDAIALPYESLVLSEMAWLEARGDNFADARARAERAVESAERSGISEMRWNALYRKALVERRAGLREEALASLRLSLDIIEDMRLRVVPLDEALVGFLEDKQDVFAEAVDLLMEMGRPEEALEVGERARSRAFLDLLRDRPGGPVGRAAARRATTRIRSRRESTIVEYFTGKERTFVWVLSPEGELHAIALEGNASRWAQEVASLLDAPARSREGFRELERALWEPLSSWLPSDPDSRITIVPHGPLFGLPFSSLIDAGGSYLVERHTIDYVPSIAVLHELERFDSGVSKSVTGCLAIGNPTIAHAGTPSSPRLPRLPGAEAEATSVAGFFAEGPTDLLLGTAATEGEFRSLAPGRAVLHLATHGSIRDDQPLESALLLAPGPGGAPNDDGRLSAREILDLPLRARLVTLSACDSGRGRVTGEGLLGLCRSFLHAGAGSVVVSLWSVSDLVGRLQMERFYGAIREGEAPAAALRRAQLDTLEALRRHEVRAPTGRVLDESPLLWAPFVLVGDGGTGLPAPDPATATSHRGRGPRAL